MRKLIIYIVFFLSAWSVQAYDVPKVPVPARLVNDYSGTLSVDEINRLEAKLVAFDDSTSNQITIVLIKNLGEEDIEGVAYQWGTAWGIGKKGKDNGVLIFCAMEDRKIRIEVGTGLEPRITDGLAGTIIRQVIGPRFKAGAYYEGLDDATSEIMSLCSGEFTADPRGKKEKNSSWLMIGFVIFIIIVLFFRKKGGGGGGSGMMMLLNALTYSSLGSRSFNGGGRSGWGGSSGGGGFGGFGGGGFSGGGASGSW